MREGGAWCEGVWARKRKERERAQEKRESARKRKGTVAAPSRKRAAWMKRYGINGIQLWVLCLLRVSCQKESPPYAL